MSCSFRTLERLPPEIFEDLATNDEEGQENDKDDTDKGMKTTWSLSLSFCPSIVLQQRLCKKLKSFSHKKIGKTSHRTKQKCIRNVGEFLKICETDLVRALDPLLTFAECRELRRRICAFCAAKPVTVLSLQRGSGWMMARAASNSHYAVLPTGISTALDALLKGGLGVGSITEIYGRAGTGKTTLALQLCLAMAARHQGAAAYIETEGKLSWERLRDLAVATNTASSSSPSQPRCSHQRGPTCPVAAPTTQKSINETLSNVLFYSACNADELRNVLSAVEVEACARWFDSSDSDDDGNDSSRVRQQQQQAPMGILVLDSIASPARREFGKRDVACRAQFLMECAKTLKRLAETLRLAVVVINHIGGNSGAFQRNNSNNDELKDNQDDAGALGNSWHHCATTRLLIETHSPLVETTTGRQVREITVTKSSLLKRGTSALLHMDGDGFKDTSVDG